MSLINDALKRAQQAQETAPPPPSPGPELRPVEEPAQYARRGLGLLLPAALAVVALLALFFVWQLAQKSGSAQLVTAKTQTVPTEKAVSASSPAASAPAAAAQPKASPPPAPVAVAPPSPPPPPAQSGAEVRQPSTASVPALLSNSQPAQISRATNGLAPESGSAPVASGNSSLPPGKPDIGNAQTNPAVVPEPTVAKPAPLKLQAIVFNPTRPSALISGKTLFIGDRIGEFRLVALTQESATMAGAGLTNVLNLAR